MAERLYYSSSELEFEATVTDVRLHSREGETQLWQMALDKTAFYSEGGGQPWDTGVLTATAKSGAVLECAVERVEEDDAGEVWHAVRKPLVAGTTVAGAVDAARRADHEQQHSGQHLVSAIFLREIGARTVSFHLGAESSTIDLVLREGMERLSEEDLLRVEEIVNREVIAGRPMMARWVPRETAVEMMKRGELRKIPEREGPLRIVEMQGIEFNACGGTHVVDTGKIGAVLLRKVEKVKQGWRVEFLCGGRAVRAARRDYELLKQTAGMLTVGMKDVPGRVEALMEKSKAMAKELKKASAGTRTSGE
jgi:alanyl-tRNA synthetase